MPEPVSEDVTLLADDVPGLTKEVRELKGAVDGLRHARQLLIDAAGIIAVLLSFAVGYLGMQVHGVDNRVDSLVGAVTEVRGELRSMSAKLDALEDIGAEIKNPALLDRGEPHDLTVPPDRLAPTAAELGPSYGASSMFKPVGVVTSGNIDPGALMSLVGELRRRGAVNNITAIKTQEEETNIQYIVGGYDKPTAPSYAQSANIPIIERVNDFSQFIRLTLMISTFHPDVGGTLAVSSPDSSVLEAAGARPRRPADER